MKRLLIGYDGSECANAALADLNAAGLPANLDVKVLTIADIWLPLDSHQLEPVFPDVEPKAVRRARDHATHALKSAQDTAAIGGDWIQTLFPDWRVQSMAIADSPAWAICRTARQWQADLVLVGSHGRSTLERMFLGSVAQKVAVESHCSVHVARPRRGGKRSKLQILIAVDGSPHSEAAVQTVIERSWPAQTMFRLVTVIDHRLESAIAWNSGYARQWVAQHDKGANEWACRMVERQAKRLHEAGFRAETHIFDGDPKQNILRAAKDWHIDCIFVGAHGLHHADKLSLGTVASAITARAHCSVEIVRPG